MIEIKNLSFNYVENSQKVLDDISIKINENEMTTILGLNGSGKTTLIKLLTGLLKPKNGNIYVKGKNLKDIPIKERSKVISYVPQLSKVDNDFEVIDYLSFSLANKIENFRSPSNEEYEKIISFAKRFKIEKLLNKKINNLSGGEKQIVTICSSFIQDTPIIILDEPTSALDLKNQSIVLRLLKEWNRENNKTFILSTHNPNHALILGGMSVILHNNKILAYGKSREIITIETLRPVYGDIIEYAKKIDYNVITTKD